MILLAASIEKTLNILEGWVTGRMVIDQGAFVQLDDGKLIPVEENHIVEVKNGDVWKHLSEADFGIISIDGWPLYAGMDARIRKGRG